MFSWLLGKKGKKSASKKKPQKRKTARLSKPAVTPGATTTVREEPLLPGRPQRGESEQILGKMGGPEALAAIIKGMLAEDKQNKRGR